ncbi:MAG TPA: hemerythrin domain-containing protein [Candidatus Limnocylindrales bacterium]|nr:hemerythrin domain-containing protein [Candidatus Limnocylindrales bacterium]
MDALDELEQMHEEARTEFAKLGTSGATDRAGAWAKLHAALKLHEQIEEKFVYDPVVEEIGDTDTRLDAFHAQHEQEAHDANQLMDRIGELDVNDSEWLATVQQLRQALEQHMAVEEDQFWPLIRETWGEDKLQDAGAKVSAAKAAGEAGGAMAEVLGKADQALKGGDSSDR